MTFWVSENVYDLKISNFLIIKIGLSPNKSWSNKGSALSLFYYQSPAPTSISILFYYWGYIFIFIFFSWKKKRWRLTFIIFLRCRSWSEIIWNLSPLNHRAISIMFLRCSVTLDRLRDKNEKQKGQKWYFPIFFTIYKKEW